MKLGRYVVACVVVVSACGDGGDTREAASTSSVADPVPATIGSDSPTSADDVDEILEPSTDGMISGIVTLSPSTKSAQFSDLCVVKDGTFSPDSSAELDETTAFAVFVRGNEEVAREPLLASQLIGGSMEFGPVASFFVDPPPPGSRDALTLPLVDGDLVIEIEGTVVSPPVTRSEIAALPQCSGTGEG